MSSNIGRKIPENTYCEGFFGRNFWSDRNTRIEAEGYDWLVVRNDDGELFFGEFSEDGCFAVEDKQEYIDKWCNRG